MKKLNLGGKQPLQKEIAALGKLVSEQRYEQVVELAQRHLRTLPKHPFLLKAKAFGLIGLRRFEEAEPVLEQALTVARHDPEIHNNLGICLSQSGRWIEAISCFDFALNLAPNDAEIWKNKGAAYHYMYRWPQAIACLVKAIELFEGDYVEAVELLASALLNNRQSKEALVCYKELFNTRPKDLTIVGAHLYCSLLECDWQDLDLLVRYLREHSNAWEQPAVAPLYAAACPDLESREILAITRAFVPTQVPQGFLRREPLSPPCVPANPGRRIRVGYLSSDFRNHPVGQIVVNAIESHDRHRLEVFGYSLGEGDDSGLRQRLIQAFDHFADVGELGVETVAGRIRDDDLDVLIDLQGWTTGTRAEVLALRPARFQGGWIGFPGTIGSERLADFIIADATVIPVSDEAFYTERIVRMPDCFLPMDCRTLPGTGLSREAMGLPENAFVFCSLNRSSKFNPTLIDAWARILRETPGSVLWLSRSNGDAAGNLANEFAKRGVEPDRLIYAQRVDSREEYLGNLGKADLALDTSPYNSHSTGMDTLWAGVPMVTLLGTTFAGRVGASLLKAANLECCIAESWDGYCDIAIDLYRNRGRLDRLRRQLVSGRLDLPLFDMKTFVAALDARLIEIATQGVAAANRASN